MQTTMQFAGIWGVGEVCGPYEYTHQTAVLGMLIQIEIRNKMCRMSLRKLGHSM